MQAESLQTRWTWLNLVVGDWFTQEQQFHLKELAKFEAGTTNTWGYCFGAACGTTLSALGGFESARLSQLLSKTRSAFA